MIELKEIFGFRRFRNKGKLFVEILFSVYCVFILWLGIMDIRIKNKKWFLFLRIL